MQFDIKQMISMVDVIAEEKNLPKETIIIMIKRQGKNIIPVGGTIIELNDVLVSCRRR